MTSSLRNSFKLAPITQQRLEIEGFCNGRLPGTFSQASHKAKIIEDRSFSFIVMTSSWLHFYNNKGCNAYLQMVYLRHVPRLSEH